jgi:hypothetical protein
VWVLVPPLAGWFWAEGGLLLLNITMSKSLVCVGWDGLGGIVVLGSECGLSLLGWASVGFVLNIRLVVRALRQVRVRSRLPVVS